jgi:hypothetical protein
MTSAKSDVLPLSFFSRGAQRVGEMQVYARFEVYGIKTKNNLGEGRGEKRQSKIKMSLPLRFSLWENREGAFASGF